MWYKKDKELSSSSSITTGCEPTREQIASAIRDGSDRITEFETSPDLFSAWGTESVSCFGTKMSLLKAIEELRALPMDVRNPLCLGVEESTGQACQTRQRRLRLLTEQGGLG
jgi:hypothetical protein